MKTNKELRFTWIATFVLVLLFPFSVDAKKKDVEEKRQKIQEIRSDILEKVYNKYPQAQKKIESAVGYATFDNKSMKILLLASGNGRGVVHNNTTGEDTYMQMGSIGAGFGMGFKDLSVVFIFNDEETMQRFIKDGWQFKGGADATAVHSEGKGASLKIDEQVDSQIGLMEVYTVTDTGVAAAATVEGTKYWRWKKLNRE